MSCASLAKVAADKVRQTSSPYQFAPMSSRERRIVHLALRDSADLRTESEGEGLRRYVVVYPKDYKSAAQAGAKNDPLVSRFVQERGRRPRRYNKP